MESVLKETKFIMNKYGINAKKSLGQNFLIDENVLEKIVESSNINNKDIVIEIGPGLGTLTKYLVDKAGKVICIELDNKMIPILNDRFSLYDNIEIINNDVLKVDFAELISRQKNNTQLKSVKIVANLPYYITTPIIMKLLEDKLDIESITVMIQKEVADRLTSKPGQKESGAITYTVYYYCEAVKVLTVSNESFIPRPEVTSEVIRLNLRKEKVVNVKDEKLFFKIIKCAFMQRRKTILNSLTNAGIFKSKEDGEKLLNELNINTLSRAENLNLDDFAKISDKIIA